MARPTTKTDLLTAAEDQFSKLTTLLDGMPPEMQTAPFAFDTAGDKEAHWSRDNNLRDVLVHLYEWHQLLLRWVAANTAGEARPFLPPPYNWKNYGEMNQGFWEAHQSTSYEEARRLLGESHAAVVALMEGFSNEELFSKGQFSWTGTTTLGSYCVSAAPSHYDWAMKKIKRHQKTCG